MALALLGVVSTLHNGMASDDEIDEWMAALAANRDSVFALNQHYVALEGAFPYLSGWLGPLTGWTEDPAIEHWAQLQEAAGHLTGIAWSRCEPKHLGDLLGRVYNQMLSIGARRTKVFDYVSPEETLSDVLSDPRLTALWIQSGSFTDAWCGSGIRVIAFHDFRLVLGLATDIPYHLNDPSPIAVAMAGLNMVSHQIGPQVTLACDTDWAHQWGATSFYAASPSLLRQVPPEVADDVPGVLTRDQLGS